MKNNKFILMLFVFFGFLGLTANTPLFKEAKPDFDSIETIFQKMGAYQQMEITLNFDSLLASRRSDFEHPAQIKLIGADQMDLSLKLKVRPRGKYRRVMCDWPPLRLNFSDTELKGLNVYHKYDKIKLVTHCKNDAKDAQTLLKEYWTYKLYNGVSDNSFRVHLMEITYIDAVDASRTMESYAFVIENNQEMAHRINGELVEGYGTKVDALETSSYQNMVLFNYMIGNADWRINTQKNLKLVRHKKRELFTIVPYDFDYSNIVSPSYVKLAPTSNSLGENDSIFSGTFKDKESLEQHIQKFKRLEKNEFSSFNACEFLNRKEKAKMKLILKTFFKVIKNKKKLEGMFLQKEV